MCVIDDVANIISTSSGMIGNVITGMSNLKLQKAQGIYKTNLMLLEAKQAEKDAAYERQEGIEQARKERLNSILNMGAKKAAFAASNIAVSSQTALNAVDDEKLNGELSALTTLKTSERRAQSYSDRAISLYNNAALNSFNTKQSYKMGGMNLFKDSFNDSLKTVLSVVTK